MGNLKRFKLAKYVRDYDLSILFETGTCKGAGVRTALEAGFPLVCSTEIMSDVARENRERFLPNANVQIFTGNSPEVLGSVLPRLNGNICFWLDAHYPGADVGTLRFNESSRDESVKYPLEAELETIARVRDATNDVFLIDDLRIYEDGPYQFGNTPEWITRPEVCNIDFVYRLFDRTHHIVRRFEDTGYLLLLPKTQRPKVFMHIKLGERVRGLFGTRKVNDASATVVENVARID